ncbi:MAG: hypothetical protein Q4D94_12790 [Bacillota bacterium]|nr:hypothetical protein [Bacillota bacterium]
MQLFKKIKKLGFKLGFQKLIGYEAIFSCAFCARSPGHELYREDNSPNKGFEVLPHSENYWYADPLMWEKDGKEVVFLERVDRKTGIGCIACADITDGSWKDPVPVIEEPYHMSFPMCFYWGNELYMIPETEMNQSVNLYRCTAFPYQWEKAGEFMKGWRLVDSVVWSNEESRVQLLASEYDPKDDFYTRYHAYELHRRGAQIEAADLGRISDSYTLMSRMAGPVIEEDTALVPIQRSTPGIYGYSVQFCRKKENVPGECVKELLPADFYNMGHKLLGVHTYSRSSHYEMIDIQYLVYNRNKWRK